MATSSRKSMIRVFVFFLLLLLAAVIFSGNAFIKAIRTNKWTGVEGVVITSDVRKLSSSKGPIKFSPHINYSYKLGDEEFTSDRYSSTNARGSSIWAKEIIDKYPEGSAITIYYNPEKPAESVVERGLQSDNYWMTGLSSFFFIVLMYAFIFQLKAKQ